MPKDDLNPRRTVTLSGSAKAVEAFVVETATKPKNWQVERRSSTTDGDVSIVLRWASDPDFSSVGETLMLVQLIERHGLRASNTERFETTR